MSHTVRKLKVRRYGIVAGVDYLYFSTYRFKLETLDSVGMDRRVFVYRRDPADPYTGEVKDTFFSVASPVDMEEYPPEEPDPAKAYPFFRKDSVELDIRQEALARETEQTIIAELNILVHALNKLEELKVVEEFWIGPFPEDTEHDSESVGA